MKGTRLILFLVVFIGCGHDEEYLPQENGDPEEVEVERAPSPLEDFDLTNDGPDEPLVRDWEFVNFQNLENGELDYRTTVARYGHASYYNGGYEENYEDYYFPLFLRLTDFEGEICNGKSEFETRTFAFHYFACFASDESTQRIGFDINFDMGKQIGGGTSFDEIDHELKYVQGLQTAFRYEISSDRLYIYIEEAPHRMPKGEYRMVFLAWDEDDELKGD